MTLRTRSIESSRTASTCRRWRRRVYTGSFALVVSFCGATMVRAAAPTTTESANDSAAKLSTTKPSETTPVEVHEWVIFITDPNRPRANARADWPNSLPPFMDSRRATPDDPTKNQAVPIGVMRFTGKTDPKLPLDIVLTVNGEAEAHYPKAETKPHRLLWANLAIDDATAEVRPIEATHWLSGLRKAQSATIHSGRQVERFLLYDVESVYAPAITLKRNGDTILATNTSSAALHNVTFYKKQAKGWTQMSMGDLTSPNPAQSSPTKGTSTTKPADPTAAFDAPIVKQNPPATVASSQPATSPSTQAAATTQPTGTAVTLSPTDITDDAALLEPWRARLETAGVMPADIDTILKILQTNALDSRWLTIVYQLEPAEVDRLLPLEIVPQPQKITRTALVIVRNSDPAIADDVDGLILQCGDPDYAKRQEATAKLTSLGLAAKPKLEQATKHKDIEIAQRAESILDALKKSPGR